MKVVMDPSDDTKTVAQRMGETKLDEFRNELDEYYAIMQTFGQMSPTDILMSLSSFTARMAHVRMHLVRPGRANTTTNNFRTKELDPFLDQCGDQFKIWSRLIAVQGQEWEQTRGQK
jgi:hypothetical protein